MNFRLEGIYFVISILLSIAIALQIEYVFFDIYNLAPFFSVCIGFLFISIFLIFGLDCLKKYELFLFSLFTSILFIFLLMWANYIDLAFLSRTVAFLIYILLSCFVINYFLSRMRYSYIYKGFTVGILSSTIILVIECLFRVFYSYMLVGKGGATSIENLSYGLDLNLDFVQSNAFYAYKYSSIMFYDANYVGLFSLCILICAFFLGFNFKFNFFIFTIIFLNFFIVIFSFSRSAILVMALVLLFYFWLYLYNKRKYFALSIYSLVAVFSLFITLFNIFYYVISDESFNTKISILLSVSNFFDFPILEVLFGYGLLNGGYAISYENGKYAHALVPILLGQLGVIGTLIYLISFILICLRSGVHGIVLLLSFLIAGFSLVDPWQILYFWAAIYMYYLKSSPNLNSST